MVGERLGWYCDGVHCYMTSWGWEQVTTVGLSIHGVERISAISDFIRTYLGRNYLVVLVTKISIFVFVSGYIKCRFLKFLIRAY